AVLRRGTTPKFRHARAAGRRCRQIRKARGPADVHKQNGGKTVNSLKATILACAALLAASACTPAPMAPTVAGMPAPGKPMEVFQQDDGLCRNYAYNSIGGPNAQQQLNNQQLGSAAVGTLLGAGLGAAIGGGRGAAIGAASGAAAGTLYGANQNAYSGMSM